MNKSITFLFFVGLLFSTCWLACNKIDDLNQATIEQADAEFAIPLFNSSISFQNIIDNFDENTFLTVDPDGLMRLNYKGDVLKVGSEDLFDALVTLVPPQQILDTNFVTEYDIPGSIDIDFLDFKNGTMYLAFQNHHTQAVDVDVYIDEVEKDGQILYRQLSIDASDGTEAVQAFDIIDLEGWRWNSLNDQFTVRYEAIKADGQRDTLSEVYVTLANLEYSYAEGYLGNDIYPIGRDTIEIDFFDNWTRGDVYFEDPKIQLTAFNSFGFPLDGQFEEILIRTVEDELIPLESEFVTNGVYIDYPRLNEVGEVVETYFSFDKENSNIREVLGAGPVAIDYRLDGEPNPNFDETIRGFMLDTSEIRVQLEVELPIYGSASGFAVRDTFEVDFGTYDQVEQAEFKLISDNNMPLSVDVQLYFTNEQGQVIDSLLSTTERVVDAAPVNENGMVTNANTTTLFIPITAERLDKILATKKIILQTAFSTTNDGNTSVRVLADHDVNVRMGVKFGLE